MAQASSPTIRRRELATRLREMRLAAGLTIDDVATRLMVSGTKLSRLETAARPASLRDVRDLCDLYEVSPEERERLMTLARDSRKRSWWQQYDLPYSTYVGLEASAVGILQYTTSIVPGLLQTEDYAHAVTEGILYNTPPDVVEQRVQARLTRQSLLSSEQPPRLWAVIDEAVLHREVGGPDTLRAQLEHLTEQSRRPHITVQVIPFEAGSHAGMDSSFTILQLDEGVSEFVYVEGLLGDHYLESAVDLTRYSRVFDHLCAAALGPKDTRARIAAVAERHAA